MESGSTTSSFNLEYVPTIKILGREVKNRIPGEYPDVPSKEKAKKILRFYTPVNYKKLTITRLE